MGRSGESAGMVRCGGVSARAKGEVQDECRSVCSSNIPFILLAEMRLFLGPCCGAVDSEKEKKKKT